ncbi:MAG: M1 family metallopeptidase [Novosphingobium sp.]|nr:M1 family metallopeptidase [Novosphingobium sp.]
MRAVLLIPAAVLAFGAPAAAQTTAAPAAAVRSLAPVPEGKLSDAAIPRAYRLDLTVDPAQPRFSGHVEIEAVLKCRTSFVDLHGRNLAMHKAVALIGGQAVPGKWTQLDPTGVARLTFPQALPAGAVTLAFDYDAPFQNGPAGLFHVHVGDEWYGWSQFESIDARAAYPGFDQPGFKQPFTVTLRTPPGLTAVSNAPELSVTRENGLDVHRFAPTLPLPTYLVALMVGPFATVAGEVPPTPQRDKPLPLRIVSERPNAAKLGFALDGTKGIVTHLEGYFGQSFPYAKLDQITAPILPGAMENAGADLYEDSILVLDDNAPTHQKRAFGMVVAHELGHQWFGDLVTPAWWDDIWLNESFANWMGYRIGNEWRPDLNIGAGAIAEAFAAMNTDALLAGRPIHQPIARNSQIDAAFDTITYGKGGQVVAMIAAFMGDDKFRDGVRRYMAAHRYGNATSADFFGAMADVAGDPRILPAMQSFTDQQGVPLLTFSGGGGAYTVTQSRYARLGTTPPETRWGVPLCLRRGELRQCTLLTERSAAVKLAGDGPLVPNAGGTGYYRFELPRAEWERLIAASASLPPGEALAVADSLRASFAAGRSDVRQLVALARTMAANPDTYASAAAVQGLDMLAQSELLDEPATAAYRRFLGALYRPMLARYGFDPRVGAYTAEDPERAQRRLQLVERLAGPARDEALRKQLGAAATAWLDGNAAALDPVWFSSALPVYLDYNKLPAAKLLLNRALASQDPVFRPVALAVIADSGNLEIARWLLDEARDPRLRQSERLNLARGVVANAATRDFGYGWMNAHLEEMLAGGGGIFFAAKLPQMLNGFCSVERAAEIQRDLGSRLAGRTGELELARTVERVRDCGLLKNARRVEVSAEIARLR